jgi:signal transduction histidine kinase
MLEEEGPLPPIERDKIFFAIDNGMTWASTEFAYVRGFKDARLTEVISEKKLAQDLAENLKNEQNQREKFFSTVTHDMRNPLSVARASAEMLIRRTADPSAIQKCAHKIITSIDRSNQMIKDLLDSNRLRSGGKLALHRDFCDLSKLILDVCDDLSDVYGPRFRIESLPTVKGKFDCSGMRRMLENLMVNAIKYGAKDKKVSVTLELQSGEIRIHVHNEGHPIPLKEQASLFDPHYRSETAKESTQHGWGIGLTLVKGIAEGHDGKVEVSSSKDAGTTFTIILPYIEKIKKVA